MTALADLAHLAGPTSGRGGNPATTWAEYRHLIDDAIANNPRSLQTRIGPSELGTDCLRCLGHKLAGIPEQRDVAWLPWIGSAVHAAIEEVFLAANARLPDVRFLVEATVSVGEVDGVDITGHADLYDLDDATVTDFKCVGVTTLRDAKANGPTATYRKQAHLYGRGFTRRGLPVERVRIVYLPRNSVNGLADAVVWDEPYDEQVALDTLARADALAKAIRLAGAEKVLPGLQAAPGCHSCARYPLPDGTYPPRPGHEHQPRTLTSLLAG